MSNDLQSKRVGALGLGFVAEGFAQVLREQLSDVLPLLIQVRVCARRRLFPATTMLVLTFLHKHHIRRICKPTMRP